MAQYSKGAGKKVGEAMHEMKEGKLKSGRSGKKVASRKQAIAIGLSEAREGGEKVPAKKSAAKKSSGRAAAKKGSSKTASKGAAKKGAAKKGAAKKSATKSSTSKRGLAGASTATKKAVAAKGGRSSK